FMQDYDRKNEEEIFLAKDKKEKGKSKEILNPLFTIEDEKSEHEVMSLADLLEYVRTAAQKGIYIQRYKGLGEMNPQQLWETTMDPQRRTILKVAVEDAVEVDKTFAMLMGDEVEPRRAFIETYAHEVKNLDV
ncbi:MAG: DNA gyrase subunit B, partial [Candidatus Omnitrophica bacterium]|nr:DNA gyrase subunit B [Candidatus Omnitrophota bacterium]